MWTTKLDWDGSHWIVLLSFDGKLIARMTLDEWSELSVTRYLIEDRIRVNSPDIGLARQDHPSPLRRPQD